MDAHAEPQPPDLSLLLPRSVYWQIVHELQTSLPSPATLTPEACAHRDLVAEAELYAAMYPRRAALIRRAGRVPDNVSFGPPDDYLVPVLVHGQTPALRALDRIVVEAGAD